MHYRKSFFFLPLLALLLAAGRPVVDPVLTLHLIGDSTLADKPGTPEENPERGWGQLLPEFFTGAVAVRNHAVNGRSSQSFRAEGRWAEVLQVLEPGDYVFIQFGHNDQKVADSTRYTNPWSGYRRNLERYVDEARAAGGVPVLLSSIVRRNFNEHGTLVDTHGAYPFVARTVARERGIPFIDMQLLTEDYVIGRGPEASKTTYLWLAPGRYPRYPDGRQDNTHLSPEGARAYAGLVTTAIRELELPLARYLR